ncbi:MAG: hypothetical protein HY043_17190 [Verrucomicrobia bacterium]|nr:hypothetical protein [Verrucomicrobiota bacterium]
MTGQVLGSPNFMPPEQASGTRGKVGRPSDVYGLGGIVYFLLTARPPFQGETLEATLHAALHVEPIAPRLLNASVPRDLETICLKCLEKEPAKRYASAQELADELGRFLKDEPIHARPITRTERAWRWCRRKPAVAALSAATTFGVIAIAIISTVAAVRLGISRRATERENYAASIALADRHIRDGETDRAIELLLKCPTGLRHWEWGRLMYLCHQDVLTIRAHTNITPSLISFDSVVSALAFDGEGGRLVTLGSDGAAKVWSIDDGTNLLTFGGPANRVLSVAFNPRERQLAMGCTNGLVRLWDTLTWRELPPLSFVDRSSRRKEAPTEKSKTPISNSEIEVSLLTSAATNSVGHANEPSARSITRLAYSADGKKLAAATFDNSVHVWNISSNRPLFSLSSAPTGIQSLFFTTDGQRLVIKEELVARLCDAETGRLLSTFDVATDEYRAVFVHPSGDRFATIDGEDKVKLWSGGKPIHELGVTTGAQPGNYRHVVFSPDGRLLCIAGERTTAKVCKVETGEEVMAIPARVHTAVFSPDGRSLVTLGAERAAKVWSVATRQEIQTLQGHQSLIQTVTFSPDGRLIATASYDGIVKLWNADTGREVLQGTSWAWSPSFSPDGQRVTMCSCWDRASVWDAQSGKEVMALESKIHSPYMAMVFSPDGKRIFTAGNEKVARVWDAHTGRQTGELRGHTRWITSLACSTNGQRIATASWDHTVRIWEARTGRELHILRGHSNTIWDVAFDPRGKKVVSTSSDLFTYDPAIVWDVETGRSLFKLGEPGSGVSYARFSPDGQRIATVCTDKTLRLWDSRNGAPLQTWRTRGLGQGLCFSPDGKRLVVPMADFGTFGFDVPMAEIWDVEQGRQLLDFQGHTDVIGPPVFSPDGRRIFTVSMDFTGRLWETFPWRARDYPGSVDLSLTNRIKLYARNYWRERLGAERAPSVLNEQADDSSGDRLQPVNPFDWPPRDPATPAELIDLTPHYTAGLDTTHIPTGGFALDDDLEAVPHGIVTFDNLRFDVRGLVSLRRLEPHGGAFQRIWEKFPLRVNGIRIARKLRRLHVLHASCATVVKGGTLIGSYVWHYADGSQHESEIIYGRDLRDWWKQSSEQNSETDRAKVVWTGTNPWLEEKEPGTSLRLFLRTYANPRSDLEVTSLDFVSKMTQAGPFLVAMTVEP